MSSDILANPILNFVYFSAIDKQVLKLTIISFVDTDISARGSLGISARYKEMQPKPQGQPKLPG